MTVLLVESWLQSTGLMLPARLAARGLDYVFLTRDPSLYTLPDGTDHPVLAGAAEVVVAETNDDAVAVAAAREAAARRAAAGHPIRGVLTTCDYYLPTVAVVAESLGLPGAPADAMRTATRKHLTRRAALAAGVPDVPHAVAATWADARKAAADLGYPLVVKPVDLNSGTGVRRVTDEAQLAAAFEAATAPRRNSRGQAHERLALLERVLDGPEYSVEAVTRDGVTTILGITRKSVAQIDGAFVETGHLFPAPLPAADQDAVRHHVVATLDAVGYTHGVSHTEVRLTSAGPRLVELNPRQCGGFIFDLVRLVTGTDPLDAVVDLALGRDPAPREAPRAASAAVAFILSPSDGELRAVGGGEHLADDARVVAYDLPVPGRVRRPWDNNDRLGYVMTADPRGASAQEWSDALVADLRLEVAAATPAR